MNRLFMRPSILTVLFALLATGCASTPARRAKDMPDVLQALPPEARERVLAGSIAIGDSRETAFLAWGRPDYKSLATRMGGESETWIYLGYRSQGLNPYPWRHSRDAWRYDPRLKRHVRVAPAWPFPDTVTYWRSYVRRQVEFQEGRVVAFEVVAP